MLRNSISHINPCKNIFLPQTLMQNQHQYSKESEQQRCSISRDVPKRMWLTLWPRPSCAITFHRFDWKFCYTLYSSYNLQQSSLQAAAAVSSSRLDTMVNNFHCSGSYTLLLLIGVAFVYKQQLTPWLKPFPVIDGENVQSISATDKQVDSEEILMNF